MYTIFLCEGVRVLRKHNSFCSVTVWCELLLSFFFLLLSLKNAFVACVFLACFSLLSALLLFLNTWRRSRQHATKRIEFFPSFWRPKRVRTNKKRKECLLRTRTPFFESRNRPTRRRRRRRRRRLPTLPEDERRRWRLQRPPPLLFTAVAFLVVSTKNTKIETNRRRRRRVFFVILFIKEETRSCLRPSKWKMKTITTARRQ